MDNGASIDVYHLSIIAYINAIAELARARLGINVCRVFREIINNKTFTVTSPINLATVQVTIHFFLFREKYA